MFSVIDSYEVSPGKGLPLGNQTSQWFAVYYLDGLDRLIKEKLRIKYYSRYMDDGVLLHPDKEVLRRCLAQITEYLNTELLLEFNAKTQIMPVKNGVNYLGWHIYLAPTGKVVRLVSNKTKTRFKRRLRYLPQAYAAGLLSAAEVREVLCSYRAHLSHGQTDRLQRLARENLVFCHITS